MIRYTTVVRPCWAIALSVVAVASLPAHAQRTGTRIDRNVGAADGISDIDPASAIRAASAFAQCVARREPKTTKRGLVMPFGSPEQTEEIHKGIRRFDECLGSSKDFDQLSSRGMLFAGNASQWFVKTEYKNASFESVKGMNDATLAKSAFAPRNGYEDFGLCVIRRNPEAARALIFTEPTTKAEGAAVNTLMADVGPCVPQGQQIKLSKPSLRSLLSYSLYRVASNLGTEK